MRKHNRLFQLKTSFVSAIAFNTIATRLLVYEMASVAIGDAFIKQGHDGIAADMLRQKRLGRLLVLTPTDSSPKFVILRPSMEIHATHGSLSKPRLPVHYRQRDADRVFCNDKVLYFDARYINSDDSGS